jgi:hypothetical protein
MRKLICGGALVALVMALAGCKIVSTPQAPAGWTFLNEGANASGVYVNGPGTPPAGRGSALLTLDSNGREAITTSTYAGQALANLTTLQYSTYQAFSGSPSETLYLEFDVDYDSTDNDTSYQGRLVFVPQADPDNHVHANEWQTWNAEDASVSWYSSASGASTYRPIVNGAREEDPPCVQTPYCDWAFILSHYPHAQIRPSIGQFMVRAGGPVTGGFVGATDNVIVGINGTNAENNFEPGDGHVAVTAANASSLGFSFSDESSLGGTASGAFVSGPNGADGTGSAQFTLGNTNGGEGLVTGIYAGTPLSAFDFLSYKTYEKDQPGPHAAAFQMDVDYDATDTHTQYQGRAVFEPALASVQSETWQTWNPLAARGWFQTRDAFVGGANVSKACTQGAPCTFSELRTAYPDAAINPISGQSNGIPIGGGIWIKAGSGWSPSYTGNADSLTVALHVGAVNGTATYDFEP